MRCIDYISRSYAAYTYIKKGFVYMFTVKECEKIENSNGKRRKEKQKYRTKFGKLE